MGFPTEGLVMTLCTYPQIFISLYINNLDGHAKTNGKITIF